MELFRIQDVRFRTEGHSAVAELVFHTGEKLEIDFAERARNRPKLKPLLDPEIFEAGRIVDGGIAVRHRNRCDVITPDRACHVLSRLAEGARHVADHGGVGAWADQPDGAEL